MQRRTARLAALGIAAAAVLGSQPRPAAAQAVSLSGTLGNKALLVVDGNPPKVVAPGESLHGVRLVSLQEGMAVVEVAGQRRNLRLGGQPVSVGKPAPEGTGQRIVLSASSDGHFITQGLINARPVQFMVDTGATAVGVGVTDAERMGLDYQSGQPIQVETANGRGRGWRVRLASVRLNDVEVRDVDAIVTSTPMPYVLLGNTFLSRFQMTRTHSQMVLQKLP